MVFEGIDGTGKTTQVNLLARALSGRGLPVLVTREPGGTAAAEAIRRLLLDPAGESLEPLTEVLLYAAARAQHVARKIRPALAAGRVVLCDRFADATLAYQGFGRGLEIGALAGLNALAAGGLVPALTFLLDMPPAEALARLKRPADRMEREGIEFYRQVRRGYLELAAREPGRYRVIDARPAAGTVHGLVLAAVEEMLHETVCRFSRA
ncbi:dTMP kinase [Desulfotomaculum copahuensis]|uniref:dTMP kinase n=1 Tax=Desulfotomaculum copahuensis TaxID=1838280 RepID=UPI00249D9ADE|nr:dTMP kinase [Desulfotomaculum copahuensis]